MPSASRKDAIVYFIGQHYTPSFSSMASVQPALELSASLPIPSGTRILTCAGIPSSEHLVKDITFNYYSDIRPTSGVTIKFYDSRLSENLLDEKAYLGEVKVDIQAMFDDPMEVKQLSYPITHSGKKLGTVNVSLDPDPTRYVVLKLAPEASQTEAVELQVRRANAAMEKQQETEKYYGRLEQAVAIAGWIWGVSSDATNIPFANIPAALLDSARKALVAQGGRDQDVQQLAESMCNMLEMANSTKKLATRQGLKDNLDSIRNAVVSCATFIERNVQQHYAERLAKDSFSDNKRNEIDSFKRQFTSLATACDREIRLQEVEDNQLAAARVEERSHHPLHPWTPIPQAPGARYDPGKQCLPGTRKTILAAIKSWSLDTGTNNLLWLSGAAGTGKSAITNTIAHQLYTEGRLAACFFFNRDKDRLNRPEEVITTLGGQLLESQPEVEQAMPKTIAKESFAYQFQRLILEPSNHFSSRKPMVILLEAFDECGDKSQREPLLDALLQGVESLPRHVKLFISSRPESDLVTIIEGRAIHFQSDTTDSEIEEDIRSYIEHRLSKANWLAQADVNFLTEQSGHLFIWADVATKFILDVTKNPQQQLKILRKTASSLVSKPGDMLNALYRTVLGSPEVIDGSLYVIGAVVTAKDPLTPEGLDGLLGLQSDDPQNKLIFLDNNSRKIPSTKYVISPLQSILRGGGTLQREAVRLLHPSLADFLQDESASTGRFFVNTETFHVMLFSRCITTMRSHLRRDICRQGDPRMANIDVPPQIMAQSLPEHLRYACRFWVTHLSECDREWNLLEVAINFISQHLLHWVEAMSLMNSLQDALSSLTLVGKLLQPTSPIRLGQGTQQVYDDSPPVNLTALTAILEDSRRLVEKFYLPISSHASHLYASALPFSPPNKVIISSFLTLMGQLPQSVDGGVKEWSILRVIDQEERVTSLAYSSDGTRIASGSYDSTVRIWDAKSGEPIGQPMRGHEDYVKSVAFSPDGTRIASGSDDRTVRIWDAKSGEPLGQPMRGHEDDVTSVAFSPDGTRIASGSDDRAVRIWDAKSGEPIGQPMRGHEGYVKSVAFSPDGTRIASGSGDRTVRIWDAKSGEPLGQPMRGHEDDVTSVAFSPDGTRIASGSDDRAVRIWDAKSGEPIGQPMRGHEGYVKSVAFSPDGTRIASGSGDRTVRIWDAKSGEPIGQPMRGHESYVTSVAFSPDGTRIASGSDDWTVRIWDAKSGEPIGQPMRGHESYVTSVAFSPDGTRIASGSHDSTVRIWDAKSGEPIGQPMRGHEDYVASVAFSPDGTHIASGSDDRTVRIWDAKSGEPIGQPMRGHESYVTSVAFSPDGTRIASGSGDRTVQIWDAKSTQPAVRSGRGENKDDNSVRFSSNERQMVSPINASTESPDKHRSPLRNNHFSDEPPYEISLVIAPHRTLNFLQSGPNLGFVEQNDSWIVDNKESKILWVPDELRGMWGPASRSYLALGSRGTADIVLDLSDYLDSLPQD